jgi:hypothetical protein
MKIIIPSLGGIGNQLFQLSALAEYAPQGELIVDSNLFQKSFSPSDFGHQNFEFISMINFEEFARLKWLSRRFAGLTLRLSNWNEKSGLYKFIYILISKIAKIILGMRYGEKVSLLAPSNIGYDHLSIPPSSELVVLLGYFQSYKYHKNRISMPNNMSHLDQNLKMLESIDLGVQKKPLVVHIRRGDYLKNPQLGTLSKRYYLENIPYAMSKSGADCIWVFTNDSENSAEYIPGSLKPITQFFENHNLSDMETLILMSHGYAFLTANSTFSWWAAYLSNVSPERIFIPCPWYTDLDEPTEMSPPSWERLKSIFETNSAKS